MSPKALGKEDRGHLEGEERVFEHNVSSVDGQGHNLSSIDDLLGHYVLFVKFGHNEVRTEPFGNCGLGL